MILFTGLQVQDASKVKKLGLWGGLVLPYYHDKFGAALPRSTID